MIARPIGIHLPFPLRRNPQFRADSEKSRAVSAKMQEESTLVRKLNTTRDNAAELLLHNNPTLLLYQRQNCTTTPVAPVAGSTLVRNLNTTSTNFTTPVATAAAAAGVLSMTTVGKGDDSGSIGKFVQQA